MSASAVESSRRPIIVQKYGGSSVADPERIRQVAERVVARKRTGVDVVVVVSAMGKTTDQLLCLAREVAAEPSRRELDMLLSVGERTTAALLSMAVHALGEPAVSLTGSQCGILTTDSHARAQIMEVRPYRVQDELEKGSVVIVAGFQGTSYRRDITTLGRGGSDLTAVALAAALGAEACEVYSDVDGIYTADPRVVPEARRLGAVTHDALEELARNGAKVMHREAVAWARRHGVALYARSTFAPSTDRGTEVRVDLPPAPTPVVAITSRAGLLRVDAEGPYATDVEGVLDDVPWCHRIASATAVRWLVSSDDVHEMAPLRARLEAAGARTEHPAGSVSVVGHGLGEYASVRRVIGALFAGHPSVLGPLSWTAWLSGEQAPELVRRLHSALLSDAPRQ